MTAISRTKALLDKNDWEAHLKKGGEIPNSCPFPKLIGITLHTLWECIYSLVESLTRHHSPLRPLKLPPADSLYPLWWQQINIRKSNASDFFLDYLFPVHLCNHTSANKCPFKVSYFTKPVLRYVPVYYRLRNTRSSWHTSCFLARWHCALLFKGYCKLRQRPISSSYNVGAVWAVQTPMLTLSFQRLLPLLWETNSMWCVWEIRLYYSISGPQGGAVHNPETPFPGLCIGTILDSNFICSHFKCKPPHKENE